MPLLGRPILWYGFFFAIGFFLAYLTFKKLLQRACGHSQQEAKTIAEKTSVFIGIGAIVGARLFDVLFYQHPMAYVHDFLLLFRIWQGGLASHGGAVGILVALWFLQHSLRKQQIFFTWTRLLDLLVIPALVAGVCIRIGNFFNQEIVGIPSGLPWAVLFVHPAGGGMPIPRHPVQLYEAIFYFLLAAGLWKLQALFQREGRLAGLFFICCFGFRFFVEFLKTKQSALLPMGFLLDMGQLLSIPLILFGIFLVNRCKSPIDIKRN